MKELKLLVVDTGNNKHTRYMGFNSVAAWYCGHPVANYVFIITDRDLLHFPVDISHLSQGNGVDVVKLQQYLSDTKKGIEFKLGGGDEQTAICR